MQTATSAPLSVELLHEEFKWTARQRQVLHLLTENRTNGEIAVDLGISLDGAKWHVGEVMSKLGVSTRDEAAEYWRAYNRLPLRFSRLVRGLIAFATLKSVATGAGALAVVAVSVLVAFVLYTARPAADVQPTELPASPGQSEAPLPGGPLTGDTASGPLQDMTLFFAGGSFASDDIASLFRAERDADGDVTTTDVLATLTGTVRAFVGDYENGTLFAAVSSDSGAPDTLQRSADGGLTWEPVAQIASDSGLLGVHEGEAVVADWATGQYTLLPSQQLLVPPAGVAAVTLQVVAGIGLAWIDAAGTYYSVDGSPLWVPGVNEGGLNRLLGATDEGIWTYQVSARDSDGQAVATLVLAADDGTIIRSFEFDPDDGVSPMTVTAKGQLLGTVNIVEDGESRSVPALIDATTGEITTLEIPGEWTAQVPQGASIN